MMSSSEARKSISLDNRIFFPAVLSVIAMATFLITIKFVAQNSFNDISAHISFANQYFDGLRETETPGFYWLYGLFSKILHVPDNYAAAYANSVFSVLCAVIIYVVITIFFQDKLEIGEKAKALIVLFSIRL